MWPSSSWVVKISHLFFIADRVWTVNAYHRTKFYPNRSNGCRVTAFTVFKKAVNCHLRFLKFELLNRWLSGKLMCQHEKLNQNRPIGFEDIVIFQFLKWRPSTILDFLTGVFMNSYKLWRTNMCRHAKFRQNWPNDFSNIAFFSIFNVAAVHCLKFLNFQIFGCPSACKG